MPDPMLNEEERMLQTLVRDFADRELAPGPGRWTSGRSLTGRTGRAWPAWG